jgi:integrase
MSPKIDTYVTLRGGAWIARLVYIENGRRQERQRTIGPAHTGRGRPREGTIAEQTAWDRAAALREELERDLGYTVDERATREGVTFEDLALAWYEDGGRSTGRPWTPATRRDYESMLGQTKRGKKGHILPTLGPLGLPDLTVRAVRDWWSGLAKLKSRNANKHLTLVRRVIAWANEDMRWGRIEDPTIGIRKRGEEGVQGEAPEFFELEEVSRIVQAAEELHRIDLKTPVRRGHDHVSRYDAAIFELLAQTGIRRGEVLALRVGDVDLDEPILTVRRAVSAKEDSLPKGKRARRIPLTDRAVEILAPLVEDRDDEELVFAGKDGGGIDADALSKRFLKARDRAGLEQTGMTLHDLRHTTGSLLARAGFPDTEIKALLGHAKLETTAIYLHHRPRAGDAERMSRALGGDPRQPRLRKVA